MKRSREQRLRWLRQAEHQLEVTRAMLDLGFWSDVCFMAEQTSQMALKAFLYGSGRREVLIHSVQELARQCTEVNEAFANAIEWGKVLDRYYIPTRYPDALAPPAVPYESYTDGDAGQAYRYAHDIVELAKTQPDG